MLNFNNDNRIEEVCQKLKLPPVSQICIVVRDIDAAVRYYENVLGLGPFVRPEITFYERYYYGKKVDSEWLLAFCSLGNVELEIIQPFKKPTLYHDFLEKRGEGIHHLGFDIQDMDSKLEICKKLGIKVVQSGRGPDTWFVYLDTEKDSGFTIELIQRKARRA